MGRLMVVLALAVACSGDDDANADGGAGADDAAPSDVTYRAFAVVSALDRVAIFRADDGADTCALVRLASPAGVGGSFGIDTPENWDVEMAGVSQGSAGCFDETFAGPEVFADSGSGAVTFTIEAGMFYPQSLSIDATISIDTAGAPSWAPDTVDFAATDLAVE